MYGVDLSQIRLLSASDYFVFKEQYEFIQLKLFKVCDKRSVCQMPVWEMVFTNLIKKSSLCVATEANYDGIKVYIWSPMFCLNIFHEI